MKSERIKELNEKRAGLYDAMEALVAGDKEMSADEAKKFDSLKAEHSDITTQIGRLETVAMARQQAERSLEAVADEAGRPEIQNYSFLDAYKSSITGRRDGLVAEMHQEAIQEYKDASVSFSPAANNSVLIPLKVLQAKRFRNAVTATGGSGGVQGGVAIATELRGFIDALRERMVLTQLGASFLTGLVGNIDWPRENAVFTGGWNTETGAAGDSSPTFRKMSLSPKRYTGRMDVTKQMRVQTSPDIANRLNQQVEIAVAIALQRAAIAGTGADNQPEGILYTTGIGDVAIGTNGGPIAWSHVVDLETAVAGENADMGSLGYLTNAKVRGALKKTQMFGSTTGESIWNRMDVNTPLNSYPVGVTSSVPSNLEKAGGSDLSALIFGNFFDLIIGQWGGLEILFDPYTQAAAGQDRFVLNMFSDVLVVREQSFAAVKDIDAAIVGSGT